MKKVKAAVSVLLVALLLVLAPFPGADAQAAESERILTLDRAVQIDDYNIVLEFSEPVAYNINNPDNSGPFTAIRLVDANLVIATDTGVPYEGQFLQWTGAMCFTDGNHDKVLYTLVPNNYFGVQTINDITSFNGPLAEFEGVDTVQFVVEEVQYRPGSPGDGCLDNITTADGEVRLWADLFGQDALDRVSLPITVDYDYEIDLSNTESLLESGPVNMHTFWISEDTPDGDTPDGEQLGAEQPAQQAPSIARIAGWLGGGVVVAAAACVGLTFLIRKAGKAK